MNTHSLISLNTKKCIACWQCMQVCNNYVFDKIDIPWHKHVIIKKPFNCENCGKCIMACKQGALYESSIVAYEVQRKTRKLVFSLTTNIILLAAALLSTFSGLIIQFIYHMGHGNAGINQISASGYITLSLTHKLSILIFTLISGIHISLHWKWYKNVIMKKKISKNLQALIFSFVFIILVFTGFIPWIIDITNGNQHIRKVFIEIHDKVSLVFIIFFILHFAKRIKWYKTSYTGIKNLNSNEQQRI